MKGHFQWGLKRFGFTDLVTVNKHCVPTSKDIVLLTDTYTSDLNCHKTRSLTKKKFKCV